MSYTKNPYAPSNANLWPNGSPQRHVWPYNEGKTLAPMKDAYAYQKWWSWHCRMLSEIRKSGEQEQRNHVDHKG